ncbi:MAG: zinc-ribbon domain-containing protein [Candidatus Omnitrophica bacterium]|nr:zinc-ribbon domain-containing protein [Candidatus Omnitrophota bacterium]
MKRCKVNPEKTLQVINPTLAKEWHRTKNKDLTPHDVVPGSSKKAWWKCPKGDDHVWEAVIASRAKNNCGCPYCSGRYADKNNNFKKTNSKILKEWHPTKNGKLKPSDFTPRSGVKVWWKCSKGDDHEWQSTIASRTTGNGCPVCSGRKTVKSNSLATLNPELAKEWHPVKNKDLTPYDVVLGSNKKVWWKCSKGEDHEWQATVVGRSEGSNCPVCANRKIVKSNCLATLNPELVKEWHPTKNENRNPYNVHPGSSFKVWWKCKHGHEWKTGIEYRGIRNQGCPKCGQKTTLPELRIFSELKTIFPLIQHRTFIKGYEVDIYIPELKVGIEYDGVFWHKKKSAKDREKNKELESKILLIRAREEGLSKISSKDIIVNKRKISIESIKKLLRLILKYRNIKSTKTLNKIEQYLKLNNWVASKHFRELCVQRNHINFESSISYLFPKIAKEWHPTKNDPFLPEYFPAGSHKHIWWKCPKGDDHVWKAAIYTRVKGHGCPICSGQKAVKSNSLATINPKLALEWHPTKNGDFTPYDVRPGSHKKVWWKCQKGDDHEWQSLVKSRAKGIGCPFCSNKRVSKDNCLAKTHPKLAREWHLTKNKNINPQNVTYGVFRKVWWKCKNGHEWQAFIANRARRGDGCPHCKIKRPKKQIKEKKR